VTGVVRDLLAHPSAPSDHLFVARTSLAEHPITSTVVNAYIHGVVAEHATAKMFRTWGGTAVTMTMLAGTTAAAAPQSRRPQLAAIDVADHLRGNTRTVARRSSIHPDAHRAGRAREVSEAVDAASELVLGVGPQSFDRCGLRSVSVRVEARSASCRDAQEVFPRGRL
jgi:DNA topoisomerase IB